MNQILDYTPNKSNKGSSGSDKIVRFFAIMLIIFALCLVASGVYKMYERSKQSESNLVQEVAKATINVEKLESTLKISVTHSKVVLFSTITFMHITMCKNLNGFYVFKIN